MTESGWRPDSGSAAGDGDASSKPLLTAPDEMSRDELEREVQRLRADNGRLLEESERLSLEIFSREAERTRYVIEAKKWERTILLVQQIQQQVAHDSGAGKVLPVMVRLTAERLGFDEVAVLSAYKVGAEACHFSILEHYGLDQSKRAEMGLVPVLQQVLESKQGLLIDRRQQPLDLHTIRSRALLLIPFVGSGETAHVLLLGRYGSSTVRRPKLRRRDVETYQALAHQLGLLLRQKEYLSAAVNAGARLEQLVRERTRELDNARQEAERANRSKSAFLSAISHELRTPLNGIFGYAQLLLRSEEREESTARGLRVIHESAEHLLVLIDGLLDLGRIEAGRLEVVPDDVHLGSFLNVLYELVNVRARGKGLRLEFDVDEEAPENIAVDATKLRQVLMNLLTNAIKFSDHGCVTLTLRLVQSLGGEAILGFAVTDEGAGIAREDVERVFRAFEQAGRASERRAGVGLGLPLSKKIVEAMGGELKVDTALGRGSTFSFELRVRETTTQPLAGSTPDIVGYAGERKSVLVVDDDRLSRLFLADVLAKVGFRVREAEDGQAALEIMHRFLPDLVITDIKMPVLDGYDLLEQISESELDIPVIATSASVSGTEQERVDQRGFAGFLPKPIDLMQAFDAVATALEVKWRFAAPSKRKGFERIEAPEPRVLDRLAALVDDGRITRLKQEILSLRQTDPRCESFCDQLQALAEVVDEPGIKTFLDRIRAKSQERDTASTEPGVDVGRGKAAAPSERSNGHDR